MNYLYKHSVTDTLSGADLFWRVNVGLAFLQKSHGGCKAHSGLCQEPPFESKFFAKYRKKTTAYAIVFFL
jgi:hypothetical protein